MPTGLSQRVASLCCFILVIAPSPVGGQVPIDTHTIRAHTFFLSHDLLRGRATGSPEAEIAAAYIAAQCLAVGLEPAAPGFSQALTLERATVRPETRLTLRRADRTDHFSYPDDLTLNVGTRQAFSSMGGPAVYLGSSDDLADGPPPGFDLRGTVAVMIGPPGDPAMADSLAASGVVGVLHLSANDERFRLYVRSRGADRFYHRDTDIRSSFLPHLPSAILSPAASLALMEGTPLLRGAPMAATRLGFDVQLDVTVQRTPVVTRNVACLLPGSDVAARDTAIVMTAHYDHLGVGAADGPGDTIFNGFSDNAAGVAMLLAIAQSLTARDAPRLRHSLLLLFPTGEERGLLGSDYYVARPLWPLSRTLAVINLDAGAPPAPPTSWRLAGTDGSGIGATAIAVAEARGWQVSTSPPKANSDYFPFTREGVPALFIIPGTAPYDGLGADSSASLKRRWDRYHQAADEWDSEFPFAGLVRYAEYASLVAQALDARSTPEGRPPGR